MAGSKGCKMRYRAARFGGDSPRARRQGKYGFPSLIGSSAKSVGDLIAFAGNPRACSRGLCVVEPFQNATTGISQHTLNREEELYSSFERV